jgi:hypothetical protein
MPIPFPSTTQRNLSVVVCLDTGRPEVLRARLAANPALLGRCAVMAWPGWGDASLLALARARLEVGRGPPLVLGFFGFLWLCGFS